MIWDKAGGTQAEFNRDKYACLQEAHVVLPGTAAPVVFPQPSNSVSFAGGFAKGLQNSYRPPGSYSRSVTDESLYTACMQARGYLLQSSGGEGLTTYNRPHPTGQPGTSGYGEGVLR